MKIKNLTVKPIGFGSTVVLPDEVGTLPQGYDKNHPTVKYYLSRKWIKEIGGTGENGGTPPVNVDVNLNPGGAGEDPNSTPNSGSGTPSGNGGTTKPLDRMNKEELQALAFERGVAFVEADTRQMIIDKIKAAQNGNE